MIDIDKWVFRFASVSAALWIPIVIIEGELSMNPISGVLIMAFFTIAFWRKSNE